MKRDRGVGVEATKRVGAGSGTTSTPELAVLPSVAREAIRARLQGRQPPAGPEPTGALARRAPVFVTLRHRGRLRGCIGSLVPLCENLVRETQERALAAAFEDPRFPPLRAEELAGCAIEVSVLGELEPVSDPDSELDPAVYGVEVADRFGRRAVLLPGIEGIDTVAQQLRAVRAKAGVPDDVPVRVRRFPVLAIHETQR